MVIVVCLPCSTAFRVAGAPEELAHLVGEQSDFWPNKFPCPLCGVLTEGMRDSDIAEAARAALRFRELTPQEAFAAFHGLGLPEERPCTGGVVSELLRSSPVRRVVGKDIPGTTRFMLDHIELWDGTKLFFGAGREGAMVYKISKPQSYVDKING